MAPTPIQTRAYKHRFRSRLEARWAVAFTEASIAWQYEPEGFDLGRAGFYLPDFWLPQVSMWAEVKPANPSADELRKVDSLVQQSGHECLLLIGPPAGCAYWAVTSATAEPGCQGWPVSHCGVSVQSMDFSPFYCRPYHLTESRFYCNCGDFDSGFPDPIPTGDDHPAIEAALSARFEHGESPE